MCPKAQFQAIRLLIVFKPDTNIMVWIQTDSQSSCAESSVPRHCEVTGSGGPDSISKLIHAQTPNPTALLGCGRLTARSWQKGAGPDWSMFWKGTAHPKPLPRLCPVLCFCSVTCSWHDAFPHSGLEAQEPSDRELNSPQP